MSDKTNTPNDPRVLRTGSQLGEYIVERVLGKGGFGITYLARHRTLSNMLVAIKEYMPAGQAFRDNRSMVQVQSDAHRIDFDEGMRRFINEARSLHDLSQQENRALANIVQVNNFFEANGTAYMVMDYISGDNLEEFILQLRKTQKKLSERHLSSIFHQIAGAIGFVHSRDLLHRDITPSNIILRHRESDNNEDYQPVLIDFGAARVAVTRTIASKRTNPNFTQVHTKGYAPLEQCDGMPQDHRSDIYGIAATMYHLTLRKMPTDSLLRRGTIDQSGKDPLIPAVNLGAKDNYSKEFLEIIDRGLALRINERPDCIANWISPLQQEQKKPQTKNADSLETRKIFDSSSFVERAKGWLSSTQNKAIAGVGALVAVLILAALLRPTPVTELLGDAAITLAEFPFASENIANARDQYLKIQLLSRATEEQKAQANTGVAICDLTSQYVADRNNKALQSAGSRLERIQNLNDVSKLNLDAASKIATNFQFESGLEDYSTLLNQTGFDQQVVDEGTLLLQQMSPGGAEDSRYLAASRTQEIIEQAAQAFKTKRFAETLDLMNQAEQAAKGIGYQQVSLESSRDVVIAERTNYVFELQRDAVDKLVSNGSSQDNLLSAKSAFSEILRVDNAFKQALDGQNVVNQLDNLHNSIVGNQSYDIDELFNSMSSGAQNTGIQNENWAKMRLGFHTLAQNQELKNVLKLLTDKPLQRDSLDSAEQGYVGVIASVQDLQLNPEIRDQAQAGLAVVKVLRAAEINSSAHRYNAARLNIDDTKSTFSALTNGSDVQQVAEQTIAARLNLETNNRGQALVNALANFRFPAKTDELKQGLTYYQTVAPSNQLGERALSVIGELDKALDHTAQNDYPAAYQLWPAIAQLGNALKLPTEFTQQNKNWLDQQSFAYGQAELKKSFDQFALKPLDENRQTTVSDKIQQSNELARLSSQQNPVAASLTQAGALLEQFESSLMNGAFTSAKSKKRDYLAALQPTQFDLSKLQASLDEIISSQESNYLSRLTSKVRTNLNAGYESLRRRPLNENRLNAFDDQLGELLDISNNTQVEFDWTQVLSSKSVVDTLSNAIKLARENNNYSEAIKTLARATVELPDNSRWSNVLTLASEQLNSEVSDRIRTLTSSAGERLKRAKFDPQAWKEAGESYQQVKALQRSDGGSGQAGIDWLALLKEVAAPLQNNDPSFILSGGNNFAKRSEDYTLLPFAKSIASEIIEEIEKQQKAYLADASAQVSGVFDDFAGTPDASALEALRIKLNALETKARSNDDIATAGLIDNAKPMLALFDRAFNAVDSRRYLRALESLNEIEQAPAFKQLNREARRKIETAKKNIAASVNDELKKATLTNNLALINGFGALALDPKKTSNQRELREGVQKSLALQADHTDALVAQEILEQLDILNQGGFRASSANCAAAQAIKENAEKFDFGGFKLGWIESLQEDTCDR